MEYQNITLSLPKDLIKKIKHIAIDKQTSISGLLTSILQNMVDAEDSYLKAKQYHIDLLNKKLNLKTKGEISWERDELHER
jgi:hypothetical protein